MPNSEFIIPRGLSDTPRGLEAYVRTHFTGWAGDNYEYTFIVDLGDHEFYLYFRDGNSFYRIHQIPLEEIKFYLKCFTLASIIFESSQRGDVNLSFNDLGTTVYNSSEDFDSESEEEEEDFDQEEEEEDENQS